MGAGMTAYLLNLFDLGLTLIALKLGAIELNPFLQHIPTMIVAKILIVGGLIYWLTLIDEPLAKKGLTIATAFYSAVVVNNLLVIFLILKGAI